MGEVLIPFKGCMPLPAAKCGPIEQNLPISTSDYPTKAVRPKNSSMSKEKIKSTFGIDVRDWKIALEEFIIEIKDKINT